MRRQYFEHTPMFPYDAKILGIHQCGAGGSSYANLQQRVAIIGSLPLLDENWCTQGTQKQLRTTEIGPSLFFMMFISFAVKIHRSTITTVARPQLTKPNHMQASPPPAKSNGEYFWRVFHVVIQNLPNSPAVATRHSRPPLLGERAGWSAVWYNSITGW